MSDVIYVIEGGFHFPKPYDVVYLISNEPIVVELLEDDKE